MFLGRYIQKDFRHIVNGVEVVIPRDVPVLRDDAVPTVFPNLPKYISKALPKERKRRGSGSHSVPPKKTRTEPEGSGSSQEDGATTDVEEAAVDGSAKHFIYNLRHPSEHWCTQTFRKEKAVSYQTAEYTSSHVPPDVFHKIAVFELQEEEAPVKCSIFLSGFLHCCRDIQSEEEAQEVLCYTANLQVCCGVGRNGEFPQVNLSNITKSTGQRLHASTCDGSVSQGVSTHSAKQCTACKRVRKIALMRLLRLKNKVKRPLLNSARKRLRYAVRTLRRTNKKVRVLRSNLERLKEKNSATAATVLEKKILELPKKQQNAVRTCFQAAKRRSLHGYKYCKEWLLECIILRMKSPRLYEHLRSHQILALPSRVCLQKCIKAFKASYGFNLKLLDCVKEKVMELGEMQRHGGLVVDEIKLSTHLDVKSSMDIEGFVDLGPFTEEKDKHTKADHGLVVMFQPFVGKWTQIIGVFASKGNVKAAVLTKIILEATILCEQAGLYVDYICCDGAPWNRTMWHKMGIHGSRKGVRCKLAHWDHVATTWKVDSSTVALRVAPKLTRPHIYLDGFQKMRVNLAFNVFSTPVLHAMDFYKDEIEDQYKNLEPTRIFVGMMVKLIEAMTSRFPAEALSVGFRYLMTSHLSQDCLERSFGIVRQASGANDHPTPAQFIIIIRCLSFYSLARSPRGTSVSPGLLDSLLSAEESLPNDEAEDGVVPLEAVEVAVDHADYVEERSDARLVYYIAGYVARKRVLSTDCAACRDACLVPRDCVPIKNCQLMPPRSGTWVGSSTRQCHYIG
ncbi:hypothetical protein HPB48_012803 [Haemaphysalis longicornis]|uniref:Transposable element P transposase n=1 Tax=Haemaphysalis longicornis TaxID=44386 RepID=A0A9J6FXZ3_HAELO|nr:hypothetical protein HPB48_012803 [Haemaphysalis longicornis]